MISFTTLFSTTSLSFKIYNFIYFFFFFNHSDLDVHDSKTPVTMLFLFPFKKQYILVTYKLKTVQIKVILKRQVIKKDKFIHIRRKQKH